ncbi:amino acid ABC transporter substrate-binding protein (PAAT family) [Aestuariispira insulae]|uniref:Amino acid ABC transporter substrate-binding protein (PAAT family) n=2 Tax=Aestuariispira insulae TaxID=1461337 RepID=A0A3D9HVS8_9PROT|nr:amino acid ABC transporter substrate-binding protein (PAAT family) [Aestuariispira insulae]
MLMLFLTGIASSPLVAADCSKKITIAWSEWAPYQFQNDTGEPAGIDIDFIRAILDQAGCQYDFRKMPWKRVLVEVKAGSVDLALGASKTAERETFARFSNPYRREYMVLFMRHNDIPLRPLSSLNEITRHSSMKIGVLRGSWYGAEFDRLQKNDAVFQRQLHLNSDYILLFKWLAIGRMDVVVNDLYNGLSLIRLLAKEQVIGVHPLIVNDNYVHFMLSRASLSQKDLDLINATDAQLRLSGFQQQIFSRYIPENYSNFFPQ